MFSYLQSFPYYFLVTIGIIGFAALYVRFFLKPTIFILKLAFKCVWSVIYLFFMIASFLFIAATFPIVFLWDVLKDMISGILANRAKDQEVVTEEV